MSDTKELFILMRKFDDLNDQYKELWHLCAHALDIAGSYAGHGNSPILSNLERKFLALPSVYKPAIIYPEGVPVPDGKQPC